MNLNNVTLAGHLTRDMELITTNSGFSIVKFGLASTRSYKVNDEWKEDVCFVDITVFGNTAERLNNRRLQKGTNVYLEGRLVLEQWESKEGSKRSKISVTANRVYVIPRQQSNEISKNNVTQAQVAQAAPPVAVPTEDIPF